MAYITCDHVSLGYDDTVVLKDLSFKVNPGDYLCIVGNNGSGKSTLMKTILGLQKCIDGKIIYDGLKQNEIGYLPQQSIIQRDFPASVEEIVLSGCVSKMGLRPFYNKHEFTLMDKNIHKMGLDALRKHSYKELSGGQQQRTLLARALCATTKLLLLDEPVASLDPNATSDLYELIHNLHINDDITIIMISHDLKDALKYATHILHIGNECFYGTKEEYMKSKYSKQLNNGGIYE